ncbi:MAG: AAA family ATPase [Candidatus Nanopelagicales bacterium]
MLIQHLTVGGLRSYGPEPTVVELAPLTLVFGPNSAGKSSLLSVLPILQQTSHRPDILALSGHLIDGGTFRMAVHQHDEALPMTLGFGWRGTGGTPHSGTAVFRWDAHARAALRSRMDVSDGTHEGSVSGPRPWGDQPGASIARRLAPQMYDVLSRVYFLGPMRARAERTTVAGQGSGVYVGPAGEHMATLLTDRPELLERVNEWCDELDVGYRVRMLSPVSHDIIVSAGDFTVLALEDSRFDPPVLVSPRAVGYGVGQLLPVITQCLAAEDGMVIVEQPEVHLHPRLQSSVGDLFIDTVAQGRGQLLVETHSEHLVLRMLRRVREGRLDADDLAILYVDLHEDGAAFVRRLEVNQRGVLVDGWPGSFFDERLAEVLPGLAER